VRGRAVLLTSLLLLAACGSPLPANTPEPTSPATQIPAQATKHYEGSELAFDYPGNWTAAEIFYPSSEVQSIVYLSTEQITDPCDHGANSMSCTRLPVSALGEDGVLISWWHWGLVGTKFNIAPNAPTVGGRPSVVLNPDPTASCSGIGTERAMTVKVPIPNASSNWIEMTACIRGPNLDQTNASIDAMLASVEWKN